MTLLPRPSVICENRTLKQTRKVIITITADALARLEMVTEELESRGLTISGVMPDMCLVTGTTDASAIPLLLNINGVESVEDDLGMEVFQACLG